MQQCIISDNNTLDDMKVTFYVCSKDVCLVMILLIVLIKIEIKSCFFFNNLLYNKKDNIRDNKIRKRTTMSH